jgi:hypothetical protein
MSIFNTVTMTARGVTGSYTKGKWSQTEGAATVFSGSFQPLNGKELQNLPEGKRAGSGYKVYSSINFDTVTTTTNPDLIILNDVRYEIIKKFNWVNGLIPHYKYIVIEVTSK